MYVFKKILNEGMFFLFNIRMKKLILCLRLNILIKLIENLNIIVNRIYYLIKYYIEDKIFLLFGI